MSKIVLGICTLQYEKRMIDSLLDLIHKGDFAGWCIPDSCLLPQSRNKCIEGAYKNVPDFTHMLFIDDDMTNFGAHHVSKLLENDVDICSALVTLRKKPYNMVMNFLDGNEPKDIMKSVNSQAVKESLFCGMAFTLIKRKVLDALGEDITVVADDTNEPVAKTIWFDTDRSARDTFESEVKDFIRENGSGDADVIRQAVLMGQNSHRGTTLVGEDIAFCRKARMQGFKIFVDCGCPVGHIGQNTYDFRYPLTMLAEEQRKINDG